MEREVAEIRLRARRRVGELSAALEKKQGFASIRRGVATNAKREALKAAGISKDEAHRCEQIAKVPLAAFETYIATKAAGPLGASFALGKGVVASWAPTASHA